MWLHFAPLDILQLIEFPDFVLSRYSYFFLFFIPVCFLSIFVTGGNAVPVEYRRSIQFHWNEVRFVGPQLHRSNRPGALTITTNTNRKSIYCRTVGAEVWLQLTSKIEQAFIFYPIYSLIEFQKRLAYCPFDTLVSITFPIFIQPIKMSARERVSKNASERDKERHERGMKKRHKCWE